MMIRSAFAIAITSLVFAAVSTPTQAAPIAPIARAVTADHGNVTPAWWARRCWRGRWGRVYCRRVWRW